MKKIFTALAICAALSACEEFQPVFTAEYDIPSAAHIYTEDEIRAGNCEHISISDLKALYESQSPAGPINIKDNLYVKGQVVSSDSTGNFYKSFYIQDASSGIEVKVGKSSLNNEFKRNQWVYVKLKGLALGAYYGSIQIGFEDESEKYETAYIDVQRIIDRHIFRGEMGPVIEPKELKAADLAGGELARCCGTLVKLENATYAGRIFCLLYINPTLPSEQRDKNHADQRVFLSNATHGVTTWAMSESKFREYLVSGIWDELKDGKGNRTVADIRHASEYDPEKNPDYTGEFVPSAYTVSQYFNFQGKDIGVRMSGYSKFSDRQIPDRIRQGVPVDLVGIITYYSSSSEFQFTVNSLEESNLD